MNSEYFNNKSLENQKTQEQLAKETYLEALYEINNNKDLQLGVLRTASIYGEGFVELEFDCGIYIVIFLMKPWNLLTLNTTECFLMMIVMISNLSKNTLTQK